jgi:hypothetical protein
MINDFKQLKILTFVIDEGFYLFKKLQVIVVVSAQARTDELVDKGSHLWGWFILS